MPDTKYYPPLSDVLLSENIPDFLSGVSNTLDEILNRVHYKDYLVQTSEEGDHASYSITLLLYERIGFTFPGTQLSLLLNADQANDVTTIPVSLSYRLDILRYVKGKDISNFAGNPQAFFDVAFELLDIHPKELLVEVIVTLLPPDSTLQTLVDDYNALFSAPISLTSLEDVANQIEEAQGLANALFLLYINTASSVEESLEKIADLFRKWIGNIDTKDLVKLFIPTVSISIQQIDLALEFPRSVLKPIDTDPASPNYGNVIPDEDIKSLLRFNVGSLTYTSDNGIECEGENSFDFQQSQIGHTGLTLAFTGMKLDLSQRRSIPEALAAGYAEDFIGVFVEQASIGLPPSLFTNNPDNENPPEVAIVGRNMLIGTGGLSGTIALETTGNPFHAKMGNMTVSLEAFDMTFKQNAITDSNIYGKLTVPGFKDRAGNDAELDIDVHIGQDGDFNITARETEGIVLNVPGIFSFTIISAETGRKDDRFYLAVSGELEFEDQGGFLGKFLPSGIAIKKLLIWEDGSIEFEGGNLILPDAITLRLGPAEIAITAIHMSTYEQNLGGVRRKYRYFGFDGGISVNPGGIDARGDGIKFYYTIDDGPRHTFIRIEGMAIDIILPAGASKENASVIISGYLAMKQPESENTNAGNEFAGNVTITLPKPGIVGTAGMRYNPKVPSFIVDLSLEFPAPIPIFPPMGIYGFRGLLGRRYVANRQYVGLAADASWYLYYKKKVSPENREGVFISKFDKSQEGFSLGVGASIATTGDDGFTFSSKVFFLLSLPEVFLIQGQANILKTRLGLDTTSDPPFSALIAISKDSMEAAFGIHYKLPDNGAILQVDALTEMAYFKKNASAWYINIGRDQPESKRVQAKILTLFNMYSYLMLSAQGIRMGAGVKYELKKKFGPIKVELGAYMDLMGKVNFRPVQLGGAIYIGGYARLKLWRFKFGLSVDAGLAIEAPKPFMISGFIKLCVRVLRKKRCAKINFTFTFNKYIDTSEIRFLDTGNMAAVNIATGETFTLNFTTSTSATPPTLSRWQDNFDLHIIPMDSHIDFEFSKGIGPGADLTDIGKGAQAYVNFEVIPPQKGKSPQVQHTYTIEEVKIWSLANGTNNQWEPYNIYNALTPLQDAEFVDNAILAGLKAGWLQLDADGKYKRLRMLSLSPLSYVNQGVDISAFTLEDLGITEQDLFCPPANIGKTCFNYLSRTPGSRTIPARIQSAKNLLVRLLVPQITSPVPQVVYAANPFGLSRGLMLSTGDQLELVFKKAMAIVELQLSTLSEYITVAYYTLEQTGETESRQPQYSYVLIKTDTLQPADLTQPVSYENVEVPVTKVVITAGSCTADGNTGTDDDSDTGDTGGTGDDSSGGGSDHNCNCDCSTCCGTTKSSYGIAASDGNEAGYLFSLYTKAVSRQELIAANISSTQRKLTQTTVSLNRALSLPANTAAEQNDRLLQAANLRFKKVTLQKNVTTLQSTSANVSGFIGQLEPLVTLINTTGSTDSAQVKALANSILNSVAGQSTDFTCKTLFFQACYLSVEDYLRNQAMPTTEEVIFDLSAITDGYSRTIHPLWRPDTTYAITIKTKDRVIVPEKTSANKTYERYYHCGFRTKGPIGHFHPYVKKYQALKAVDREDEFLLSTLKPYIDFARSYPNADSRLTNAKPMFYEAPKLYLFYKFAYIYNMYGNFDAYNDNVAKTGSLKVLIKDPAEPTDTDSEFIIEQTGVGFVTNAISVQQPDTAFFNNLTRGSNCVQVVPVAPIGINTAVDPGPLKPLKLYAAIFMARYDGQDQEVHRFSFQTSRYKDFGEQINSYKLYDEDGVFLRDAVYDNLAYAFSTDQLTAAAQVLTGTLPDTAPLLDTYQDTYDVLMTGLFAIEALPPAETTEVNLIRNTSDHAIIGLLIRNPEPLNDPKITPSVLATSVSLSLNGGPTTDHLAIFSKDNANVFISNAELNLAAGDAAFTFHYYQFNGAEYQELDSVSVTITLGSTS